MKIVNNLDFSIIYYTIDNGLESSIFPREEKTFVLGKSRLAIYWKNGYNENNYMIRDQVQCNDGIYTISAPYKIPKLTFEPWDPEKDTYCDEEYRMVAEESKKLSQSQCFKNNCACLGGRDNKHNPQTLVEHLMYLVHRGPLTEGQLRSIVHDLFN